MPGFATDPASIQIVGTNGDPNPFFKQLMTCKYLRNVIISPHVCASSAASARLPRCLCVLGLCSVRVPSARMSIKLRMHSRILSLGVECAPRYANRLLYDICL